MKVSRLNSIEQYVISRETVSIDELCEVFGVSKNTIRRDLTADLIRQNTIRQRHDAVESDASQISPVIFSRKQGREQIM